MFFNDSYAYKLQFVIIGSQNAITYKEVFPLLKENRIWLGAPFPNGNAYFDIPPDADTSLYANTLYLLSGTYTLPQST